MGTINYRSNEFITIGYRPVDCFTLKDDPNFLEWVKDSTDEEITEDVISEYAEIYNQDEEEFIHDEVKEILKKYDFRYLDVSIEPGYYEGFYIKFDFKYLYFDDTEDKREAQKEITQFKKMLVEMVDAGLCQVWPGWSTGYADYKESIKGINEAIKEMRQAVKETPTEKTYNWNEAA